MWNGVLGFCREQLRRKDPDTYASIALSRQWDLLLVLPRRRVHSDVLPPTELFPSLWRVEGPALFDVPPQERGEHGSLYGSHTALAGMHPL